MRCVKRAICTSAEPVSLSDLPCFFANPFFTSDVKYIVLFLFVPAHCGVLFILFLRMAKIILVLKWKNSKCVKKACFSDGLGRWKGWKIGNSLHPSTLPTFHSSINIKNQI